MKTHRTLGYYPLFVDLKDRRCVVVGGGAVAQRKVVTLRRFGARVTVISPTVTSRLRALARAGQVRVLSRRFRPGDLRGAWLVYAATDSEQINRAVSRHAARNRIFSNVVDQRALCSFIAPALAKRGALTIAVSTGGASPTVAKRLRDEVDRMIGPDYMQLTRLLRGLREPAKRRLSSSGERRRYFDALVKGRVFRLIRAGKPAAAKREALAQLRRRSARNGSSW